MATYLFLSDEWIAATKALRDEYRDRLVAPATTPMRLNLVVTNSPAATGDVLAHLDTTKGEPEIELGHLLTPDATVTVDHSTARAVFVDGNLGAAMEAMQLGRIKVDGDMMKLMSLAGLQNDAVSIELGKKIRAITE